MPKKTATSISYKNLFLEKVRQNYQSLILGLLVFLVGLFVIVKLVSLPKQGPATLKKPETAKQEKLESKLNKYTVKKDDTLWAIAENHYGSGFNAYDIVKANEIVNPDLIETGQELILPSVEPKYPTKGMIAEVKTKQVVLKDSKYTVKQGDYLWKIALEAYGDGYQWVKVAKVNNLSNPDLIYVGNVLTIPR